MSSPINPEVESLKKKLETFLTKYKSKNLSKEEVKEFCQDLIDYCKITRHSESKLKTPELKFKDIEVTTDAYYTRTNNSITINEKLIDNILNRSVDLRELINTIGHEMKHYGQNSSLKEYEEMSIEQQQLVSEEKKASIDSYSNYSSLDLTAEDIEKLHDLLAPYLKDGEIPEGYTLEEYYEDISYAAYYTILAEKEARDEGNEFAKLFFTKIKQTTLKGKFALLSKKSKEVEIIDEQIIDERENYVRKKKKMSKYDVSVNDNDLFKMAEKVENIQDVIEKFKYKNAMLYLIKDKTIEQKQALLKNAIFNNYSMFSEILINSIEKDINLKGNKNKVSKLIHGCLTGAEYSGKKPNLNCGFYFIDYSKVMNEEDHMSIIDETLKEDKTRAEFLISFSKCSSYSLETVIRFQENFDKENQDYEFENFFKTLFSKVDINKKLEFLESNKLRPMSRNLLINSIKNDKDFEANKDRFNEILNMSQTTKKETNEQESGDLEKETIPEVIIEEVSEQGKEDIQNEVVAEEVIEETIEQETGAQEQKPTIEVVVEEAPNITQNIEVEAPTVDVSEIPQNIVKDNIESEQAQNDNVTLRKRFDINSENGMNDLFAAYAQLNQKYYDNKHKRTPEEIQKRRNMNAQMKRILQKKLKEEKEENTGLDLDTFVSSNFSDNLIEEVAKNKGATLKLFNIMASGVYERNGERIRLTQKQRQALASVLEQVSEKRLNMDSPQKKSNNSPANVKNIAIERGE